jgi:hypothetical protein
VAELVEPIERLYESSEVRTGSRRDDDDDGDDDEHSELVDDN